MIKIPDSSDPECRPKVPESYYDDARREYWVRDASGVFMRINESSLVKRLKREGADPRAGSGQLSEVDTAILQVQEQNRVFYAGPLAGHSAGTEMIEGRRILVTDSPTIIEPKRGDWSTLRKLIRNLLGSEQTPYLLGWLKIAYESLRSGNHRPGQALVLAGERDCGKSLLQQLITRVLGGRSAKPYHYMMEGTGFNSDLFCAEHLVIDDEAAKTSVQMRRNFGAKLKGITVDPMQRCHAKHRDALMLTPFWRLSISVNDEPENLMVLPILDASIADKMIILKATRSEMPMPTASHEQRRAFWAQLEEDIPGMLAHLQSWKIPKALASPRFGLRHFHHPEILSAVEELAPEVQLMQLIDVSMFPNERSMEVKRMRAEEIQQELEAGDYRFSAQNLFTFARACGTYLARLAKKHPERVRAVEIHGVRHWKLFPPVRPDYQTPEL